MAVPRRSTVGGSGANWSIIFNLPIKQTFFWLVMQSSPARDETLRSRLVSLFVIVTNWLIFWQHTRLKFPIWSSSCLVCSKYSSKSSVKHFFFDWLHWLFFNYNLILINFYITVMLSLWKWKGYGLSSTEKRYPVTSPENDLATNEIPTTNRT